MNLVLGLSGCVSRCTGLYPVLCVFSTHSPKKLLHGEVNRLSEHLANKSLHRRHGLTAPPSCFRHVPNGAGED